ncbi:DUF1566 domain-containing protein [Pelagicoccus sp. SDUM812005]|uniref:Lcl domain-containing protein n=1 Tax=Pelagicoccus sp. SDUM812005 TaxID=3041257 RepID=UPI00280F4114|nr:DUF1566 domain-containing protein [Pelagicoccus sp. SDUM812005]MDQ8182932.1 DUF1566 domain-containing protein [Pelagicoccus sp. SDUM812005]
MMTRLLPSLSLAFASLASDGVEYPIVDTGQVRAFDERSEIEFPEPGDRFFGQDAHYAGNQPGYQDNGDGTVSDLVTGLMWTQDPGEKLSLAQARKKADKLTTGGHDDWRLPSIKELYSLILFSGRDVDPNSKASGDLTPFIDPIFNFQYGDTRKGERIIDAQYVSNTEYVGTTMGGSQTVFGVNFADGRIKGYPIESRRGTTQFFALYVRGNPNYGTNRFQDNGDGTITDHATGLTWMKQDSQTGLDWPSALEYAENLELAGHTDWRLPNAKELQSILDYSRSPDATQSAAIDPIFENTEIVNEGGEKDFAHYWTSTTHANYRNASAAVYLNFGRSLGFMPNRRSGSTELMDVHGAGAQRSDPKVGDASRFPQGRGPQGDVIRTQNLVRAVRGGVAEPVSEGPELEKSKAPIPRAQENGRPQPGGDFLQRADRNGDGKVSRQEFRGPDERFDRLDKNGDGFVTADEAPQGRPRANR